MYIFYDLYMLKRDNFVAIVGTAQWSLKLASTITYRPPALTAITKVCATNSILYSSAVSEHEIQQSWYVFTTCDNDGIQ